MFVYCGLAGVNKISAYGKTVALSDKKYFWVPTITGSWAEIDNDLFEALYRAAEPYRLKSIRGGNAAGSNKNDEVHTSHTAHELWVSLEEVSDILMMTGFTSFTSSEVTIGDTIRRFRHFLPGVPSGKICFQELLLIFKFHIDNPAFSTDEMVRKSATSGFDMKSEYNNKTALASGKSTAASEKTYTSSNQSIAIQEQPVSYH